MNVWCHLPTFLNKRNGLLFAGLILLSVVITTTFISTPASAAADINKTISFQGRLFDASGSVVPDGYYNMQFKLYQDGSGAAANNPDGTLMWTESYINNGGNNGVHIRNGFFSVRLGSETPFGTSVDWNQDTLWLSMNIAGYDTGCTAFGTAPCAADGEMLPMKQMSATPYAMNAGSLNGKKANDFIQNSTSPQAGASFNITGIGVAESFLATTVQADTVNAEVVDRSTAGTLTIGSVNATSISLAQDVTVGAGKTLTLAGGNTSARPSSPTEGTMYYDTESKQMLVYTDGKWKSDGKTATKIVAASNSSQTTKDGADFVANGEVIVGVDGDQQQINAAIAALPGGQGAVYLSEGTYYLDATINLPSNVSLIGEPGATVVTINNNVGAAFPFVTSTTSANSTISNIRFDGNRANNGNNTFVGITVSGGSNIRVSNSTFNALRGSSLQIRSASSNIFVAKNIFTDNQNWGVDADSSSRLQIEGNTFTSSLYATNFEGVTNSIFTLNIVESNTSTGSAPLNIRSSSNYNMVTNNTFRSNLGDSIRIATSQNNTVNNNVFIDNGGTGAYSAVVIEGNSNDTVVSSNTFRDSGGTGYAINISGSTADDTYISNNSMQGTGANSINDLGTGTIFVNQVDATGKLINKSASGTRVQTSTNNTSGFSVHNASGTNVFNVNTTNGSVSIGTTANGSSLNLQGGMSVLGLPSPAQPTVGQVGTAGTTTYGYKVTALDGTGETMPSTERTITTGNATLSGAAYNTVTWSLIPGATQYRIYRTTSTGTPSTLGLIGTVNGNVGSFSDTGIAATTAAPTQNTSGGVTLGGSVLTSTLDGVTLGSSLSIGDKNATLISVGTSNTEVKIVSIATGSAGKYLFLGTTAGEGSTSIQGGTGGISASTTGSYTFASSGLTLIKAANSGGAAMVGIGNNGSVGNALDVTGNINTSGQYRIGGSTALTSSALTFSGSSTSTITSATGQVLSMNSDTGIRVGDGSAIGNPTLLTLDGAIAAPTTTLYGSMYYDTTLGKVQCYEEDGWGACGAAPDSFVALSPEYAGAVINETGTGTVSTGFCSDTLNINDGSSAQPTICGTNETYNYYRWTATVSTSQTRSIFVTYQLPSNFKGFVAGTTSLMARTTDANTSVSYQIYRNTTAGLTDCGSATAVSSGAQTTWQKGTASGTADPSQCGFVAGDSVLVKVDMVTHSSGSAYVSNLNFVYSNE